MQVLISPPKPYDEDPNITPVSTDVESETWRGALPCKGAEGVAALR